MDTGTYVETTEEGFSDFAGKWLKSCVGIKGSTWQNYESYLHLHVKPVLGSVKLQSIRPSTIQDVVAHSARKAAVKDRIIYLNPAVDFELPKVIKPKVQPPDKKDLIAIRQRATPK